MNDPALVAVARRLRTAHIAYDEATAVWQAARELRRPEGHPAMKPLKTHAAAVEEAARHVAVAEKRASELRRQLKEAEDEVWRRATDLCDAERRLIEEARGGWPVGARL